MIQSMTLQGKLGWRTSTGTDHWGEKDAILERLWSEMSELLTLRCTLAFWCWRRAGHGSRYVER